VGIKVELKKESEGDMGIGKLRKITGRDLPLLVLVDSLKPSIFGTGIKIHQHGLYTHAMLMHRIEDEGEEDERIACASQELTLREVLIDKWLKGNHYLKIWHNPDWTDTQKVLAKFRIYKQLNKHWFKRVYDFLGIFGQAIHCDWINVPWWYYCSEAVAEILSVLEPDFKDKNPDPKQINDWCNSHKQMVVYDRFIPSTM